MAAHAKRGLTLIEVLVAISIASILTVGIERLLDTAMTSWRMALEEVTISRMSESALSRMIEGDFGLPGIRDAVELVDATETSLAFVPMWVDVFDQIPPDGLFYLTKQRRPGSPPPISEIKFRRSIDFKSYPVVVESEGSKGSEAVSFGFPIQPGSIVRISYHPDFRKHPEVMMQYRWDQATGNIERLYNNEVTDFNLVREGIRVREAVFSYYDGNNQPVDVAGTRTTKASLLSRISAVRMHLKLKGVELEKSASTFVNIRALGKSGLGIILSKGLELPLPPGEYIRLLQLINFSGVTKGQVIDLEIKGAGDQKRWRIKMFLGVEGDTPAVRRYEVYYPTDSKLVFEEPQLTLVGGGFNLLQLEDGGVFDYDDDEGVADSVQFEADGNVLAVRQCDPEGVALVIRP